MQRQFPIKKSPPDPKDFKLVQLMAAEVLNEEKINSGFCGPIYDQGESGFCWGFMALAFENWLYNKHKAGSAHHLSPLYLIQAVKNSSYSDYPTIEGESIRAAVKGLQKAGSVAEVRYPYSKYTGGLSFAVPSAELLKISERFRIGPYAAVLNLNEITTSLSCGKPVMAGVVWTDRFFEGYQLAYPYGNPVGGHAILLLNNYPNMTLFGRKGWIKFQNSWGKEWGENGFGWIAHDYLRESTFYIEGYTANYLNNRIPPYKTNFREKNLLLVSDDIPFTLDQAPIIIPETGRMVLPIRAVAELFGCDVNYEPVTKNVSLIRPY